MSYYLSNSLNMWNFPYMLLFLDAPISLHKIQFESISWPFLNVWDKVHNDKPDVRLGSRLLCKKNPSQSKLLHLQDNIRDIKTRSKIFAQQNISLLYGGSPESRYGQFHLLSKTAIHRKLLICAPGRNLYLPLPLQVSIIVVGLGVAAFFF